MVNIRIIHMAEIRELLGERTLVFSTGSRTIGGYNKDSDYDYWNIIIENEQQCYGFII